MKPIETPAYRPTGNSTGNSSRLNDSPLPAGCGMPGGRTEASGIRLGCVIMASGLSRRFGDNKLLADFCGEPMIMQILRSTEGLFARRVVVTRYPEIVEICSRCGIDVHLHDLPYRSDTVRLGLASVGDVDGCMFCAADQPLLRRETIEALIRSAACDRDSIWRPCFGERPGSPVLFPRWAFDQLMNLPEGKGGGYVIGKYPERVRMLPVADACELMDADDRETLARLVQMKAFR